MKKLSLFIALTSIMLLFQNCATIVVGTKQQVSINSTPDDATVYAVNGKQKPIAIGKTPLSVEVSKKVSMLILEKPNYCDTVLYSKKVYRKSKEMTKYGEVKIKTKIAKYNQVIGKSMAWYYGNLLLGGVVGCTVDLVTGAYIDLPKNMEVNLKEGCKE